MKKVTRYLLLSFGALLIWLTLCQTTVFAGELYAFYCSAEADMKTNMALIERFLSTNHYYSNVHMAKWDYDHSSAYSDSLQERYESAMDQAYAGISDNDTAFFYHAGHGNENRGITLKSGSGIHASVTYPWMDLAEKLTEINCDHIIVVLDTCFSGKLIEAMESLPVNITNNITVITACNASETAKYNTDTGENAYTCCLDWTRLFYGDRVLNENEYFEHSLEYLNIFELSEPQHPQIWHGRDAENITMYRYTRTGETLSIPSQKISSLKYQNTYFLINWPASPQPFGYHVQRRRGTGDWITVKTISDWQTLSWEDTNQNKGFKFANGDVYSYRVISFIGDHTSDSTNTLSYCYLDVPASFTCKSTTKGKASLSWKANTESDGYVITYANNSSFTSATTLPVEGKSVTTAEIPSLTPGKKYYFKVKAYKEFEGKKYDSADCTEKYVTIKMDPNPAKQDITKVENVVDGIRITWPKSSNAEGYKILRKANNGTWKTIKTIKDVDTVQYIDTEVNNGVLYTYTVKGYVGSTLSEYNKTGLKMYRLSRVYITECKSPAGGKAIVTWSKRGVADGYFVYYSQSSKFETFTKKTITGPEVISTSISGLAKGKTYYFKVRPFKLDGKTYYGVPSAVKSVKIKKPSVEITESSLLIKKNDPTQLTVTVKDVSKSAVKWASSNTSVATVSSDGVVTGLKAGNATITASADGASDTCNITVHPFDGGSGTKADPYLVKTLAQLKAVKNYPKRHFKQTANINGNNAKFAPLFSAQTPFSGSYNGAGYTIKNLVINGSNETGLFAAVGTSGRIEKLKLSNITVTANGSDACAGSLVGVNWGTVVKCHVADSSVSVPNEQIRPAGGLMGHNGGGTVEGCTARRTTVFGYDAGGIIGSCKPGNIISCHAYSVSVTGGSAAAGVLGSGAECLFRSCSADSDCNITCYGSYRGQVIGYNLNVTIE